MPLLERLLLRGHIDRIKSADQDINASLQEHWQAQNLVLIVGAVGAVTRLIAPRIEGKEQDRLFLCLTQKATSLFPYWVAIPLALSNAPGKSPWIWGGKL